MGIRASTSPLGRQRSLRPSLRVQEAIGLSKGRCGQWRRSIPLAEGTLGLKSRARFSAFLRQADRCDLSLESGDATVGKDGPISAYAPWADIDLSQGGSDTRVSVNPNGGHNPHSPYAPLPTASEKAPSLATRGCALIPGNAKLPRTPCTRQ